MDAALPNGKGRVQRVLIGVLLVSAVAYQGYRRRRQAAIPTS